MNFVAKPLWSSSVPVMQNRVYRSQLEATQCRIGTLDLVCDDRTSLVYNTSFNPTLLCYDQGYNNEQALSAAFEQHLQSVLQLVLSHVPSGGRVVEVGCGKGTFLKLLRGSGIDATGFDPAYEGDEPYIQNTFFCAGADLGADVVILRHVLEHIPNPYAFLTEIAEANGGRGTIFIEVPDLSWIIQERAFYDLFYEHCNYFTTASLHAAFRSLVSFGTFFGSQYQWVAARLDQVDPLPSTQSHPPDLSPIKQELGELAAKMADFPRRFVWGAGAKGATLAYLLQGTESRIDYLIDINPSKQGCFSPGSGTLILSPATACSMFNAGDAVLIINPNYRREIEASLPIGVAGITVTDLANRDHANPVES